MIQRIALAVGLVFALAGAARADYVTAAEGGYGPFVCEKDGGGAMPSWGFDEIFSVPNYVGTCERWRGDIDTGSGHPGRPMAADFAIRSARTSPQSSSMYICDYIVLTNAPVPCHIEWGWASSYQSDPSVPTVSARAHVPGYTVDCPLTPGMAVIHDCSAPFTPYDGSGIPTAVIADGIAQNCPGPSCLPYGSPLKNQPTVGTDVSCVADLANYPLLHASGKRVAVYTCP